MAEPSITGAVRNLISNLQDIHLKKAQKVILTVWTSKVTWFSNTGWQFANILMRKLELMRTDKNITKRNSDWTKLRLSSVANNTFQIAITVR